MFYTRADYGGFGLQQRHCLTLHVRAHQRAVGIVVFEERNKRGCHRYHLTGADVHIIYFVARYFRYVVAIAHKHTFFYKPVVFVKRLVRLSHSVTVFFVRRHISHFVGDAVVYFIHFSVRRFDKAVFVDARVRRQRVDKSDILSFGRFYRAHSRIVRIMNVAHFERRAVAVESARTESRKFALVGKFGNRIGFVHKLTELRRTEKFFYGACDRTNVDERLRSGRLVVLLNLHSFAHHSFKTRNTYTELILQQLAHRTHAAVSEMVDVVHIAYSVAKSGNIIDGGDYVVDKQMFNDQQRLVFDDETFELFHVAAGFFEQRFEYGIINHFVYAQLLGIAIDVRSKADVRVADNDVFSVRSVLRLHRHFVDAEILYADGGLFVDKIAFAHYNFARGCVHHVVKREHIGNTRRQSQLFVEFISAHAR